MTLIDDLPPTTDDETSIEHGHGARVPLIGVCLVISAVLADLALQTRASAVAAVAAVLVLCVGLAAVGGVTRWFGRMLLVLAVATSVQLAVRASTSLVAIDLVTVAVLIALAVTRSSGGPAWSTRFGTALRRLATATQSVVVAPPAAVAAVGSLVPRPPDGTGRRLGAVLRGVLLATPVLAVLGLLLASADPVFASMFSAEVDPSNGILHLAVIGAAIWIGAGCFVAAARPGVADEEPSLRIGATEALVVVAGLTGLYALFAWSRFVAARRGADDILATNGLTYAEYARSGFFQLLWVAGLTAAVLLAVRSAVELRTVAARRTFAAVGCVACVLTLVVVHAAIVGLELYSDAFGLTLLRIYSSVFAWWLGAAFVLLAVSFLTGVRPTREWLPSAVGATVLIAVVALNLANPSAMVVEHNVERHREGESIDATYISRLSADATPATVDALPELDPSTRNYLTVQLCLDHDTDSPTPWNLADQRAAAALDTVC